VSLRISVITPCFNAGPFLLPCLESVAAQGEVVSTHIVMDGGSTDGSVEVLEQFALSHPHVVWCSERDQGQSDALNKALALVQTPFFGWLNADDCYFPKKLGLLVEAANAVRPGPVSIVYGDYKVIDSEGALLWGRRQPSFNFWDCLHGYLTVQNCAAIFNTQLLRKAGSFDPTLRFCMDYDLILKLARQGDVIHVRDFIGTFRHHSGTKTSTMADVCAAETYALRARYTNSSRKVLLCQYWLSKARVAFRMAREGCLASRLGMEV
jgi:glycosyltransferase involved in cell wall biosynthesis